MVCSEPDFEKLRSCRLFVLDMDGTLYLGDTVLPGARELIAVLADTGRQYVYLTNNSSRSAQDYIQRLHRLGFPCGPQDVFTSGQAAALLLREQYPDAGVCCVGTAALCHELEEAGVRLTQQDAAVVLAGFDTELTYKKLDRAVSLLRGGAAFLACNPDFVCPLEGGAVLPDCGSICALLTAASGRTPAYIGKPDRRMIDILSRRRGIANGQICCVGDRLYTDIAAAENADAVSALVLSGETTPAMLAASALRPDYVFDGAAALAEALKA